MHGVLQRKVTLVGKDEILLMQFQWGKIFHVFWYFLEVNELLIGHSKFLALVVLESQIMCHQLALGDCTWLFCTRREYFRNRNLIRRLGESWAVNTPGSFLVSSHNSISSSINTTQTMSTIIWPLTPRTDQYITAIMSTKQAVEQIPDPPLAEIVPHTSPSSPEYRGNDQGDNTECLKDKAGTERTSSRRDTNFVARRLTTSCLARYRKVQSAQCTSRICWSGENGDLL
jgi:hypothetical protein